MRNPNLHFGVTVSKTCLVLLLGFSAAASHMQPAHGQSMSNTSAPVRLPDITVSAAQTPLPVDQVGSSVTILTAQQIEQEQSRTFPDLLQRVPGLNVVQTGGPGGSTSVFIRGTNSNHVKVLIDGIDVSDPSSVDRTYDFGRLTTADISRVEILRGPQSGLYGSDAIGGVISITTKKGEGPPKVTATLEGGSFGTFNQTLGLRGSSNQFNYSFVISHMRSTDTPVTPRALLAPNGRVLNDSNDNWTASTNLGAKLTDNVSLNFVARYTLADLKFTGTDYSTFPAFPDSARSNQLDKQFYTRGEVLWDVFDGRLKNQFGVAYSMVDRKIKSPANAFGPVDPTSYNGERIKYNWLGEIALIKGQTLFVGLEAEEEQIKDTSGTFKNGNRAGFMQLVSKFNDIFQVASNIRYDDNDRFGGATTYRIAPAITVPLTGTILKASYGTGFKAPTLNQLFISYASFGFFANPNLKPEESRGFDAGFEQPLLNDKLRFGATYFQNDIKNLIAANASFTTNINIGRAKTQGVEAFVSWQAMEQLKLRGDYTYTIARNEILDQALLRRPRNKVSLQATWTPVEKLSLVATIIGISSFIDGNRDFSIPRLKAPGYAIVNLAANYQISQNVTAFGRIDNLFDHKYQDPTGFLRPGMGAYAGIRATY